MAITFKPGWNREIISYASRYGQYRAFLSSFDEAAINRALFEARGKFNNQWAREFIKHAMDPFDQRNVVTIEQGTHQVEDTRGGGFCLHFTGRDTFGYAFHFYIDQKLDGKARIFEITYMDRGRLVSCKRLG